MMDQDLGTLHACQALPFALLVVIKGIVDRISMSNHSSFFYRPVVASPPIFVSAVLEPVPKYNF